MVQATGLSTSPALQEGGGSTGFRYVGKVETDGVVVGAGITRRVCTAGG